MPVTCEGADLLYALYFHMESLGLVSQHSPEPPEGTGTLCWDTRVL